MKQWLFRQGDDKLTPAAGGLPYERGKQTGEGRKSDDYAMDSHPSMTDRQLDALERGNASPSGSPTTHIPRSLLNSDPGAEATQRGRTRIAYAAANAIDKFINGSSSDDDTAVPQIPVEDRYAGVKQRQAAFMNAASEANPTPAISPFERYRTRMGERTGSSGLVEAHLAQRGNVATPDRNASPPNTKARPLKNASADRPALPRMAHTRSPAAKSPERRLLVADAPLKLAPAESKPSVELAATSERTPSGHITHRARGSLEIVDPGAIRTRRHSDQRHGDRPQERPSPTRDAPLTGELIENTGRNQSMRTPLRSIEEGRTTREITRVQNVRVVQPRYLIPREFVYGFGAANILGLCIGCVTLAIGIRNANYLRGPHSNTLIPEIGVQIESLNRTINAFAAQLGLDVGRR